MDDSRDASDETTQGLHKEFAEGRRADELFRGLLDSAPDAMIIVDGNGEIVLVNTMAERMFGYSRNELVGEAIEIVIPERFRNRHREYRTDYRERPHVRPMGSGLELTGCRKDGAEFPVEISLSPIKTTGGMLVFGSIRDISERKLAEKQIETNLRMQQAISSLLRISLESISLKEMLHRTLELLFSIPWLELESKGAIFLLEEGSDELTMEAQIGLPDELLTRCAKLPIGKCLCGRAAATREILFTECVDERHQVQYPGMTPHGHYCVPILSEGRLYGVVNLYLKQRHTKDLQEEFFLSTVAGILAGAIRRKRTEKTLHEREFQLFAAQAIQQRLLPNDAPALPGFDVAGAVYPAEFAAGDHFDYLPMNDEHVGIMIGDVSGHGFSSSLVMATTHAYLRSLAQLGIEIDEILAKTNSFVVAETKEDMFMTAVLARLEPRSRTLTYVNAGHPTGYVLDASGHIKARLESTAVPLAVMPEMECPIAGPVSLDPGDLVFLLTDGALETRNADGTYFGTERALEAIKRNQDKSAKSIVEALHQSVIEFSGQEKLTDDVTAVVIKVLHEP